MKKDSQGRFLPIFVKSTHDKDPKTGDFINQKTEVLAESQRSVNGQLQWIHGRRITIQDKNFPSFFGPPPAEHEDKAPTAQDSGAGAAGAGTK